MKTVRKHVVPAHEIDVPEYTCDLCGAPLAEVGGPPDLLEYTAREYEPSAQITYATRTSFDCCGGCFAAKVLPALEALGLKPRRSEWES